METTSKKYDLLPLLGSSQFHHECVVTRASFHAPAGIRYVTKDDYAELIAMFVVEA
jgi:hypothetical protein